MRYLFGLICVGALCVFPLAGCSETAGDGGGGGDAGTGGIGGDAGDGGDGGTAGANTASLVTLVTGWDPEMGATGGLEGVEVCETDTTNCEMTDVNGNATLTPVIDAESTYTLDKESYGSYLEAMVVSEDGVVAYSVATDARIGDMHERVMSAYPMVGTGSVFIELNAGLAGATFVLVGAEGKAFYWDEDKNWDASLTATTSTAGGGFVEVSPGEYEIEVGGTAENCDLVPGRGWPSDAANSVRFPVREGYLSRARLDCDDAP